MTHFIRKFQRFVPLLLLIVIISFASFEAAAVKSPFQSYAMNSNIPSQTYSVKGQIDFSLLQIESSPVPAVVYEVGSAGVSNSSLIFSSHNSMGSIIDNATIVADAEINTTQISPGSGLISGLANVTLTNSNLVRVDSPPQLLSVTLVQNGMAERVWSGYLRSSGVVGGYAYYNRFNPAILMLEYENYNSTLIFSGNVAPGSSSFSIPVHNLHRVQALTGSNTITERITLPLQLPERYDANGSGLGFFSTSSPQLQVRGYNSTTGYFNEVPVPAIQWNLTGAIGMPMQGNYSKTPFNATVIGLYGTNGTALGFVDNLYASDNLPLGSGAGNILSNIDFLLFVDSNSPSYSSSDSYARASFDIGGANVLVFYGNNSVEGTANLTAFHHVSLSGINGTLVSADANSTRQLLVLFSNNSSSYVNQVSPFNVTNSTFSYDGLSHFAQKVSLYNSTTGYLVFNVPLEGNASVTNIQVFKEATSGTVLISNQNYYLVNGELQIFDDPSSTYYVVYPQILSNNNNSQSVAPDIALELFILVGLILFGVFFIWRGARPKSHTMSNTV